MAKKGELPRIVKLILLLIPGVNYVYELIIRWGAWIKKPTLVRLIVAIVSIFGVGVILGFIDFVCVLLTNHLFLE